jgi:hypothetical protein
VTNVFIVPAGDRAARENFERTIARPAPRGALRGLDGGALARARAVPDGVRAWGAKTGARDRNVGTWRAMQPGDRVLFYRDKRFPLAARVLASERSATVAKRLWGIDGDGETWECMYLLDELRWIEAPRRETLAALGYEEPDFYPLGFMRVNRPIDSRYASVEEMLADLAMLGEALDRVVDAAESGDDSAVATAIDPLVDRISEKALREEIASRTTSATPKVLTALTRRIVRDRKLVADLKLLYGGRCQCCGFSFVKTNGQPYSEVAHLRPISLLEAGLDTKDNLLVLCPNHHRMLDHGPIEIEYDAAADKLLLHEDGRTSELVNKHIGPGRPRPKVREKAARAPRRRRPSHGSGRQ